MKDKDELTRLVDVQLSVNVNSLWAEVISFCMCAVILKPIISAQPRYKEHVLFHSTLQTHVANLRKYNWDWHYYYDKSNASPRQPRDPPKGFKTKYPLAQASQKLSSFLHTCHPCKE